ncbi:hypothetical protein Sste5346_001818 [Sporothrix stenoceras]|uniref:RGS domain-containing protein n=1 Tax=Sporothrix stenoceras TaxID=5173 RepID=A0ABR3ZL06_9PEZI
MASPSHNRRRSKNHSREASLDISFENTVQNKSLQPCDLNGFMDYLYYVERRAENLQFFLWYCDYVERWSRLPSQQRQMAPVWGPAEAAEAAQEDAKAAASAANASTTETSIHPPPPTASINGKQHIPHSRGPSASSSRSHSRHNLSIDTSNTGYPYGANGQYKPRTNSVASTATAASVSSMASVSSQLSTSSRLAASIHQRSDNAKLTNILTILENLPEATEPISAVEAPKSKHTPSRYGEISPGMILPNGGSVASFDFQQQQPFHDELSRVVRHYVAANGERPLPDLFPPERLACLRAAKRTTHPSALLPAFLAAESALREQSFPMFVRDWCVGNIEKSSPRLVFVKIMALVMFLVGVALDIVLILLVGGKEKHAPPGMLNMANCLPRIACLAFWWPALAVLLAAWRKIDLLLHFRAQRLLRPWEIDDDDGDDEEAGSPMSAYSLDLEKGMAGKSGGKSYQRGHRHQASTSSTSSRIDPLRKVSLQALGPRNDPESEPWARRQRRTPFYRRLSAELWPASTGLGSRTVAVQHTGVRSMQNRAVWGAVLWAGLASATLTVISLFIPSPAM